MKLFYMSSPVDFRIRNGPHDPHHTIIFRNDYVVTNTMKVWYSDNSWYEMSHALSLVIMLDF